MSTDGEVEEHELQSFVAETLRVDEDDEVVQTVLLDPETLSLWQLIYRAAHV